MGIDKFAMVTGINEQRVKPFKLLPSQRASAEYMNKNSKITTKTTIFAVILIRYFTRGTVEKIAQNTATIAGKTCTANAAIFGNTSPN